VLYAKKKDTKKLIVQGSRISRKSHIQRQMSQRWMVMILTHLYFHYHPYCLLSEESKWILDTNATYHACHEKEWYASF